MIHFYCLECGRKSDLSPLKGMPLTSLNCYISAVTDLSPLQGMPLTTVHCHTTPVSDLSPLQGLPLTTLNGHQTQVSDLSPLAGLKLTELRFTPASITRGLDVIRILAMPSLRTIGPSNGVAAFPATEFWQRYDKGEFRK